MRILGVSRDAVFSPGRESDDAAIFNGVARELSNCSCTVDRICENTLCSAGQLEGYDAVFQMARNSKALDILSNCRVPVINSVDSVRNCSRIALSRILSNTGLMPDGIVCGTQGIPSSWNSFPCWVKSPGSHAYTQGDVAFVIDMDELRDAIKTLHARGIDECVVQRHISGQEVKFYGVEGYGIVDISPDCRGILDMERFTAQVMRVAGMAGLSVFGGDAVIGTDGSFTLIDLNDWPSFRTCTAVASGIIANKIINETEEKRG